MKRALLILALSGGSALLTASCAWESDRYKSYPPNPYPDLAVVAIFPFLNHTTDARIDGDELANIMASELAKFTGFRVIRPAMIRSSLERGEVIRSVDDVLRVARRLQADAVISCALTDYDPYDPPKAAVSVQFLRVSGRRLSGADIDRIVQSASWRRGPMPLARDRAGHWLAAFEEVYDSHEERIREELIAYAHAQDGSDSPFPAEREFLAVQARFMQFVSNQIINRILETVVAP